MFHFCPTKLAAIFSFMIHNSMTKYSATSNNLPVYIFEALNFLLIQVRKDFHSFVGYQVVYVVSLPVLF